MRYLALALALCLTGCITDGSTQSLKPVCEALVGPIHYTSSNIKKPDYAGPSLAPQLAVRNNVGQNLDCPGY